MAGTNIVVAIPGLVVTPILMMKMMEMEVAEVVLEGDVGGVVVVPGPTLDLQLTHQLKLRKERNTVEEEQSKWIYTQSVHMPDVGVALCTYGSAVNKGVAGVLLPNVVTCSPLVVNTDTQSYKSLSVHHILCKGSRSRLVW